MSNYSTIRKRLEAEKAVRDAALDLHLAFRGAKGTTAQRENDTEVLEAKVKLAKALETRDGDVGAAFEKALSQIGLRRTTSWLFADGVANPEAK